MRIVLGALGVFALLLTFVAAPAVAQDETETPVEETMTIGETENVSAVGLFWPIFPGRTEGDFLFPLKILKEQARAILIFGNAEKLDNQIFRATKRMVEADSLLTEGDVENAGKSMNRAVGHYNKAARLAGEVKESGGGFSSVRLDRVRNMEEFLPVLQERFGDRAGSELGEVQSAVSSVAAALEI